MKSLYKIKCTSAFGNCWYVIESENELMAKQAFYFHMPPINKIISDPIKTTKRFILGAQKQIGNYYFFPIN